jgi:hypothetical protein
MNHLKSFLTKHRKLLIFTFLFFAVLLFSLTAITHRYGPYHGKVVDAETDAPIEGAAVYMVFTTKSPNPGGATWQYAGAAETLTDAHGEFELTYRALVFHPFSLWEYLPTQQVFKPGYGMFPKHKSTSITPEPDACCIPEEQYVTIRLPKLKTKEERIENLSSVSPGPFDVPYIKRKHFTELESQERINLGFSPLGEQ